MKVNELVELIESNKYLLRESILNDENPYLLTGPNNLLSKDKISNYPIIYSKYITNLNDLNKLNDIFNKNKNYKKKLTINIDDDDDEDQDKDKDYEFQHGQRLIDTEPTHLFDGLKEGELDITVNKEAQDVIKVHGDGLRREHRHVREVRGGLAAHREAPLEVAWHVACIQPVHQVAPESPNVRLLD
ncbi:hypothetical protein B5S32_g4340 [[Candida] boidinii]|nr:hypothetical protein B5S32_g4340 [[Candida] boidinii]